MKTSIKSNGVSFSISSTRADFMEYQYSNIKHFLNSWGDSYQAVTDCDIARLGQFKLFLESKGLNCGWLDILNNDWFEILVWDSKLVETQVFNCGTCGRNKHIQERFYPDLCHSCFDDIIEAEKENQYEKYDNHLDYIDRLVESYWYEYDCLQWAIREILSTIPLVDVSWYSEYAIGQATLLENRWVELTESLDKPDDQLDYLEESLMGYV